MFRLAQKSRIKQLQRVCSVLISITFTLNVLIPPQTAHAGTVMNLPVPGSMVALSEGYVPMLIRGVTVNPQNNLEFNFIVDTGNTDISIKSGQFKSESEKLIKYFLASLTIPEKEMWVNLSPYEKERITSGSLGQTEMGRELLGQDYLLKQLTASLIYPEDELGQKFWNKVYEKAYEKYGTTQIPVNTFNKVWIMPDKGVVYEHGQTAFVLEQHLKVMLEEDYLARDSGLGSRDSNQMSENQTAEALPVPSSPISADIIREIILPAIEKEVNEGKNFAPLRQIYNSMILATWYKMTLKESLLGKVYVDQDKMKGIEADDPSLKEKIYEQYITAFRKGVFSLIKEEEDIATGEALPRKYFSGGMRVAISPNNLQIVHDSEGSSPLVGEMINRLKQKAVSVRAGLFENHSDRRESRKEGSRRAFFLGAGAAFVMSFFLPGWDAIAKELKFFIPAESLLNLSIYGMTARNVLNNFSNGRRVLLIDLADAAALEAPVAYPGRMAHHIWAYTPGLDRRVSVTAPGKEGIEVKLFPSTVPKGMLTENAETNVSTGDNARFGLRALLLYSQLYSQQYSEVAQGWRVVNIGQTTPAYQWLVEMAKELIKMQAPNGGIYTVSRETARVQGVSDRTISSADTLEVLKYLRGVLRMVEKDSEEKNLADYLRIAIGKIEDFFLKSIRDGQNKTMLSQNFPNPDKNSKSATVFMSEGEYGEDSTFKFKDRRFTLAASISALRVLGPAKIDASYGPGTSYEIWNSIKALAGQRDRQGNLTGIGLVPGHSNAHAVSTFAAIRVLEILIARYRDNTREHNQLGKDLESLWEHGSKFLTRDSRGLPIVIEAEKEQDLPNGEHIGPRESVSALAAMFAMLFWDMGGDVETLVSSNNSASSPIEGAALSRREVLVGAIVGGLASLVVGALGLGIIKLSGSIHPRTYFNASPGEVLHLELKFSGQAPDPEKVEIRLVRTNGPDIVVSSQNIKISTDQQGVSTVDVTIPSGIEYGLVSRIDIYETGNNANKIRVVAVNRITTYPKATSTQVASGQPGSSPLGDVAVDDSAADVGVSPSDNVGGIDLDASQMDLQIKRDGNGVPLPVEFQPIGEMKIDGFTPVIINIAPVNIPLLLGLKEEGPEDEGHGTDLGLTKQLPADEPRRPDEEVI